MSMSGGVFMSNGVGTPEGGWLYQRGNGMPEGEWYTRGGMVYQRGNGIPVGGYTSGWVYRRRTGIPESRGGARYTKDIEQGIWETHPPVLTPSSGHHKTHGWQLL